MPGSKEEEVINHLVGARLKSIRKEKHLSLRDMADCFKVSTQQLQKYEDGTNRVSAAKLFLLCLKYNIDINYFGVGSSSTNINNTNINNNSNNTNTNTNSNSNSNYPADVNGYEADLARIVNHFRNITDKDVRKSIVTLVESVE